MAMETDERFGRTFLLFLAVGISIIFFFMVRGFLLAVLMGFTGQALSGLGVVFGAPVTLISVFGAIAIMLLDLFVAFLQAFIFAFLTCVFIAQLSLHEEHHEEQAGLEPVPA